MRTHIFRRLNAALAILLASSAYLAQQRSGDDRAADRKIDGFVRHEMLAHQIPGVSLAVLRKGKCILLKSCGLANVEHQVPVKPSTIYQSGSMGKQFTNAG